MDLNQVTINGACFDEGIAGYSDRLLSRMTK